MRPLLLAMVALLATASRAETLTLEDALSLARTQHPLLTQADGSLEVMTARLEQARGVLFPQLNANGLFNRSQGAFARAGTGTTLPTSSTPTNLFSVGLTATQVLWDFGAIERLRVAGFNREAQTATRRAVRLQVELGVRRAYFVAAAQAALVDVAQKTLDNAQLADRQADALLANGRNTGIEVAATRTRVAAAQVQLINAKNALSLSLVALAQAIGVHHVGAWELTREPLPPVAHEADPLDALVTLAIDQRPEVAALRRQQEAAVAQRLASFGGYLPTLNASGSVSAGGTAVEALQPNWAFGVNLQWNLFNGLQTTGQVHEAEATARVLQGQLDAQALQVRTDVETAQATVTAQLAAVDAAQLAVDAARQQLTLAEARLAAGVGSALEIGDAQVQFTTAHAQWVQAQLNVSTARAQLLAALGVLHE